MRNSTKDKKHKLVIALRKQILTLELPPGANLDEASLADKFGLSRTPLREVFQQLAGEGFVALKENRGARVSGMGHETLRNFFLVAPMIYAAIARLAAANATPNQVEQLKQAQIAFRTALRSGATPDRALANNRFHALMGEMADNPYLTPSLNRLLIDHARIGMTFYRPQNADMVENLAEASRHHDEFIEAIARRDEERAASLAVEHWNLSRHQIEIYVLPNGLNLSLGDQARTATA